MQNHVIGPTPGAHTAGGTSGGVNPGPVAPRASMYNPYLAISSWVSQPPAITQPSSSLTASTAGNQNSRLPGRPAPDDIRSCPPQGPDSTCNHGFTITGVCAKQQEVCYGAKPIDGIPGFHSGIDGNDTILAAGEDRQDPEGVPAHPKPSGGNWSPISTHNRVHDICPASCPPSTTTLQGSPTFEGRGLGSKEVPELRQSGATFAGGSARPAVVDRLLGSPQWPTHLPPGAITGPRVRCLQERMGGTLQGERSGDRGYLDSRGVTSPYQLAGVESSLACTPVICEAKLPCSDVPRQPGGHSLHQPDAFPTAVQTGRGVLGMVSEPSSHSSCGASPRQIEQGGGLRVSPPVRLQRLETEPEGLPAVGLSVRPVLNRPVCLPLEHTDTSIFQLETRPAGNGGGCSGPSLELGTPICVPPLCPNRSLPTESAQRADGVTTVGSTDLASSSLVPPPVVNVEQRPGDPTIIPRPTSESSAGTTPSDPEPPPCSSRVAHIRNTLANQGISQESAAIICKSWRKGTAKSYDSAWRRWVSWCDQRSVDPFSASLADIVQFLTDLHVEGKEYSTVNTYRSAISMSHVSVDGVVVGKYPTVCRLMQGIFNSRPPKPKYKSVWDVDVVVTYIRSMEPSEKLPLSWKLVTLMALTNADRASDLHALDLKYRRYSAEGVTFEIPGLTKTRRSEPPRQAFYSSFAEKNVCPVETLRQYERKTADLRSNGDENPLFISFYKPYKTGKRLQSPDGSKTYWPRLEWTLFSRHTLHEPLLPQQLRTEV